MTYYCAERILMSWDRDRGSPPSQAAVEDVQLRTDSSWKNEERSGFCVGESLSLSSEYIFYQEYAGEEVGDGMLERPDMPDHRDSTTYCLCKVTWSPWERGQAKARFILLGESDAKLSCLTESLWGERSCAIPLCMCVWCQAYAASLRPVTAWVMSYVRVCVCEHVRVYSLVIHRWTKNEATAKLGCGGRKEGRKRGGKFRKKSDGEINKVT